MVAASVNKFFTVAEDGVIWFLNLDGFAMRTCALS
jgi:hypothetical protein